MKRLALVMGFVCLLHKSTQTESPLHAPSTACLWQDIPLYGKVQVVESFPDIKVKVVSSFPDLDVQQVTSFPNSCGKWQFVESFPDFKIQYVESFPDLEIRFVKSFPGMVE